MEARAAVKRVEAREAGLTRRRATLRERLAREAEAHAAEMAGTRASAEAKRAQLEARARELLAKREEEREKHAEEMEYRKFLESDEGAQREMREKLARGVQAAVQVEVEKPSASNGAQARMKNACMTAVFIWLIVLFMNY